jgi:hypothetical protein
MRVSGAKLYSFKPAPIFKTGAPRLRRRCNPMPAFRLHKDHFDTKETLAIPASNMFMMMTSPITRSLVVLAALLSLAMANSSSEQVYDDSMLSQQQRHYPALFQLVERSRHLQEDLTATTLVADTGVSGTGCVKKNGRLVCNTSYGQGTYQIEESCTTGSGSTGTLSCDVCAIDKQVLLDDGSFVKFCYEFLCSVDKTSVFDGDFSSACECVSANVNGELCSVCDFCEGSANESVVGGDFSKSLSLYTPPLALQCPHMDQIHSECPPPQAVVSSNANIDKKSGGGMNAVGKFGTIFSLLSLVVGLVSFVLVSKQKKQQQRSRTPRSTNTSMMSTSSSATPPAWAARGFTNGRTGLEWGSSA